MDDMASSICQALGDEPGLDASRAEVDAWLMEQDDKRALFLDPNRPQTGKMGGRGGSVDESATSEQAGRRAALRRDSPLLTAWAEAYAAVDELGGGREAVRPCDDAASVYGYTGTLCASHLVELKRERVARPWARPGRRMRRVRGTPVHHLDDETVR